MRHAVSVCRSRSLWGPYELHPDNPILTSFRKDHLVLKSAGHGCLVQTQSGGLFALALVIVTPPYALLALLTAPLPRLVRYRVISGWSRLIVWLARALCGVRWRVEGGERLPARPAVILAKHQSAWETMAFQLIFPPQSYLLKRELLWLPFFGWGLALMSPIAINRTRGVAALRGRTREIFAAVHTCGKALASSAPRSSRMRTAFSQSAALLGVRLPLLR